jgi:hypothetical protein
VRKEGGSQEGVGGASYDMMECRGVEVVLTAVQHDELRGPVLTKVLEALDSSAQRFLRQGVRPETVPTLSLANRLTSHRTTRASRSRGKSFHECNSTSTVNTVCKPSPEFIATLIPRTPPHLQTRQQSPTPMRVRSTADGVSLSRCPETRPLAAPPRWMPCVVGLFSQ